MWEDEIRARIATADVAAAKREPLLNPEGQSYCPLTKSTNIYRPARLLYLPCYECTLWLPLSSFSHSHQAGKRSLAYPRAHTRFCISCGIKYALWPPGLAIKVSGLRSPIVPGPEEPVTAQTLDGNITSITSSANTLSLPPNSQSRANTQKIICSKCGGSFRSIWYCCIGCFNVIADTVAKIAPTDRPFNLLEWIPYMSLHRVREGVRLRASADFWDGKLGYLPFLLQLGLTHPMDQERKYVQGMDQASAIDSNTIHRLEREQLIGMEARCADCWRPPTFPTTRDLKPDRGPRRERYANAVFVMQIFGMQQIQRSHFCQRCMAAVDARPRRSWLRESRGEIAIQRWEAHAEREVWAHQKQTISKFRRIHGVYVLF
jgi:hypothetical protein